MIENIRMFDESNAKNETASKATEEGIYLSLKTNIILIESEIRKAMLFVNSN